MYIRGIVIALFTHHLLSDCINMYYHFFSLLRIPPQATAVITNSENKGWVLSTLLLLPQPRSNPLQAAGHMTWHPHAGFPKKDLPRTNQVGSACPAGGTSSPNARSNMLDVTRQWVFILSTNPIMLYCKVTHPRTTMLTE